MKGGLNPTQALILGALLKEKKSGAQITAMTKDIRGFWNHTRTQVYREAPRLEEKGYIKIIRENVPEQYKELYQILPEGRRAYKAWASDMDPVELLRNPWVLRRLLAQHDGSDVAEVCKAGADYYRRARARLELESETAPQLGGDALRGYFRLMEDWFAKQVV